MPASVRPSQIPGNSGGSGSYIIGAVVLVGLAGALFAWKKCGAQQPPTATPQVTTVTATATQEQPVSFNAPPPPPKIEEVPDAGSDGGKTASNGKPGPAGPGPCSNCSGTASSALSSALRSTASSAQGCYQRALRTNAVSGAMTVAVQVSASGTVCSASIANDTTGSGEIRSCVMAKFNGRSFPPPTGGCVTVNIPINFTIKDQN